MMYSKVSLSWQQSLATVVASSHTCKNSKEKNAILYCVHFSPNRFNSCLTNGCGYQPPFNSTGKDLGNFYPSLVVFLQINNMIKPPPRVRYAVKVAG